jgi:hypothetical protein
MRVFKTAAARTQTLEYSQSRESFAAADANTSVRFPVKTSVMFAKGKQCVSSACRWPGRHQYKAPVMVSAFVSVCVEVRLALVTVMRVRTLTAEGGGVEVFVKEKDVSPPDLGEKRDQNVTNKRSIKSQRAYRAISS